MHIWYIGLTPAADYRHSLPLFVGLPNMENHHGGHSSGARKESTVKHSGEYDAHYLPLHHIKGYNVRDVVDTHCNAPVHEVNGSC